jgi:opacity protein-like surface antigen
MTTFSEFSAFTVALAASLTLLAPSAAADHETPPPTELPPQQQPEPAPPPFEPRPTWPDGFYYLWNFDLGDAANPSTDADFDVDIDWSIGTGLGVGFRFARMLRLEGEIHANWFRVGSLDLGPAAPFPTADYSGGIWAVGAMANLVVDLPAWGTARPYLGAGYGFSRVAADYNESVCIVFCWSTENEVVDDWDFAEAWQAMAGIAFTNGVANSETYIGYRYFETDDLELRTVSGVPFIQEGIQNHTLSIGIRFLM